MLLLALWLTTSQAQDDVTTWTADVQHRIARELMPVGDPTDPAVVLVQVDETWAITEVSLQHPSGDPRFDRAALEVVRGLGSVPLPPESLRATLLGSGLVLRVQPPATPSPCRDAAAIVEALRALDPSPAGCLGPQTHLGLAGLGVEVAADGSVTGFVATEDPAVRACWLGRVATLRLPPADCSIRVSWPLSVDPR